jgi:hypothetical protein
LAPAFGRFTAMISAITTRCRSETLGRTPHCRGDLLGVLNEKTVQATRSGASVRTELVLAMVLAIVIGTTTLYFALS